jgi:hypothetical protein
MAGSTTTGGVDATARAAPTGQSAGSARWLVPVAAAAVLAGGLGVAGFKSDLFKKKAASEAATSASASASQGTSAALAPSAIAPTASVSAVASARAYLVDIVAPADAKVEVDNAVVAVRDGKIEVRGPVGSAHPVHISAAGRELNTEVFLAESGARPPRLELSAAQAAVVGRPAQARPAGPAQAGVAAAPVPRAAPVAPPAVAKPVTDEPPIDKNFGR